MADIPTVYQKRSQEVTIVAADIKDDDDDANREVKNLPVASGVSGVVSEAGKVIAVNRVLASSLEYFSFLCNPCNDSQSYWFVFCLSAQRTFLVQGALTMLHCLRYMAEFMQP